ncbi:MAG: hypothetical protein AB7O04_15410 [Hyphomonadaceae bacterium]
MGKYEPLKTHLSRRNGRPEMLSFEEIETIIGARLPQSAHKWPAFWANDEAGHHVHARAWIGAGYRVAYVSRETGMVRFERFH